MLTTIIFLTLAACAFIFVCGSFLLGGDHDVHFDHDASHDGEANSISVFSPKVIGIFLLAFGAGGAASSVSGLGVFPSTLIGFGCGLLLGFVAFYALNLLHKQQANSLVSDISLIGCTGYVVTRIPVGSPGEISYIIRGQSDTALARSDSQVDLPVGTKVKIVMTGGNALVVESI